MGLGVRPNSELAERAGLRLSVRNSIAVDESMRTSHPAVWAAGDCASTTHLVTGKPFWVALGTVANKSGRVAGISMGGGRAALKGVLGTAMSKHCSFEVARTGLSTREAEEEGGRFQSVVIKTKTRAGYFPGAENMYVKLLAEEGSGQACRGSDRGRPGGGQEGRHNSHGPRSGHDGGGARRSRPGLRPSVLHGVGPGAGGRTGVAEEG